jgi:hypothetical protein
MDAVVVQDSGDLAVWKREHLTAQAKGILKRTAEDILELSRVCHEFREEFGYKAYVEWVEDDLGLNSRMGDRMLNVFDKFGITDNLSVNSIGVSALYALAAPSTPDAAREEAIAKVEAGERITHAEAQELIRSAKEAKDQLKEAQAELAMKPQIVEREIEKLVVPSDYEGLVRAKGRLEEELKDLKETQAKSKKSHSESARKELEKLIRENQGRLDWFKREIERLTGQYEQLDAAVGAQRAYTDACRIVRESLLKISFQLQEAFAEYPIPDEFVPELKKFALEMRQGSEALDRFLSTERLN